MKTFVVTALFPLLLLASHSTKAAVFYVDLNSSNPTPPYATLSTAATDIQSAIDAASDGDKVLVNNGTYQTGGRTVYGILTNRVVIDKAITVQSLNGPGTTIIQGYQVPGNIYGTNAVRCVYMTNNASLIGFTLTNGSTLSGYNIDVEHLADGGGIWCESTNSYVSNCVLAVNSAWDAGAGVASGTLDHCLLTGNSSPNVGGGAIYSVLNDCVISNNFAEWGGGGAYGDPPWVTGPNTFLNHCLVISNYTYINGGGVYGSMSTSCQFIGNSAIELPDYYYTYGGAAEDAVLINCTLKNNYATEYGGGADQSRLQGCLVISNSAGTAGGGVNSCQSVNCTIINNSSGVDSGGARDGTLDNCIVYYNSSPANANFGGATLNNCCTFPTPTSGAQSFTNTPLLVDLATGDFHLQSNSPCINVGNNAVTSLTADLDGNPRIIDGNVDVGAYEFQSLSLINLSIVSHHAGFDITGQSNQVVIVETSTNLVNWSPLATNKLGGHPFPFVDPALATLPKCFYRAQSP